MGSWESHFKNVTVNFAHNFSFNGSVYLGDGTQHPGADGIAFFFHDGSNTDQGFNGNGFGIGSLTKAFGFKFDTFTNNDDSPFYEPDPKVLLKDHLVVLSIITPRESIELPYKSNEYG